MGRRRFGLECLGTCLLLLAVAALATADDSAPAVTAAQVEADWLRQDAVRGLPLPDAPISAAEDAAGGCDGIKDGAFGFHTAVEDHPWWQVDLGRAFPLGQIFVFNRCDGSGTRAARLEILLSSDGKQFERAFQHNGTPFRGVPDNRPLIVDLPGPKARYVRLQLPERNACLHLDEVEIYPTTSHRNVALTMPATQSSVSRWSNRARPACRPPMPYDATHVVQRGLRIAERLARQGVAVDEERRTLRALAGPVASADAAAQRERRLSAHRAVRRLALRDPLVDFRDLLLVKRTPARFTVSPTSKTYTHMSDQFYGWFSRPGGGLFVLQDFKGPRPRLRSLTAGLPPGNVVEPDLSFDGQRVLFSYCRYYADLHRRPDKLDKSQIPEEAFYHLYEVAIDGSGLRRLTQGKYDDFDGCYLPDGRIAFLSTRRGQTVQCSAAAAGPRPEAGPDSFVRCGGDPYRPVSVYTLHTIDADGSRLQAISPFEMFEWSPNVDADGRILYARWDYVDRDAMPYMSLWSTRPDGSDVRAVFGNYTPNPHCMFEARRVPHSSKIVFTASAHHANTAGSLVLVDPRKGFDGMTPMTRLTPEVAFPEIEGWPDTYFANPYPLSEDCHLVAWSDRPLCNAGDDDGLAAMGVYLFDASGNLELLCRDPALSCMYPLPVRSRPVPPVCGSSVARQGAQEGQMLVADVYRGLEGVARGTIRSLRLVGIPAKTQPQPNTPAIGLTGHDPGKFVLGTAPVESDGSASFRVPAGVPLFIQALDAQGQAVQTMRSATYVQPGERTTSRATRPPRPSAPWPRFASRRGSRLARRVLGPWTMPRSCSRSSTSAAQHAIGRAARTRDSI